MSKHNINAIRQGTLFLVLLVCELMINTANAFAQEGRGAGKSNESADKALAWFRKLAGASVDDYLRRIRPGKVPASFKAQVVANVTKGGEIRVSPGMRSRLAALNPVLQFHDRADVVEIKVINLDYAFVGFQARAVLLISEKALNLLTTEELQATVAHEMGHEYFWNEYHVARRNKQFELMREIELRCDGIAVLTLDRLGLDPSNLAKAIHRIRTFNLKPIASDTFYYPTPTERLYFIRKMTEMVKGKKPVSELASTM
jgi:hypothetical protein